jgi:hypothetical protein
MGWSVPLCFRNWVSWVRIEIEGPDSRKRKISSIKIHSCLITSHFKRKSSQEFQRKDHHRFSLTLRTMKFIWIIIINSFRTSQETLCFSLTKNIHLILSKETFVGTAHINSDAGQSQFRRHPMLSNGLESYKTNNTFCGLSGEFSNFKVAFGYQWLHREVLTY